MSSIIQIQNVQTIGKVKNSSKQKSPPLIVLIKYGCTVTFELVDTEKGVVTAKAIVNDGANTETEYLGEGSSYNDAKSKACINALKTEFEIDLAWNTSTETDAKWP